MDRVFLPIFTFFIIIMIILAIPKMNFDNILPFLFFDNKKAILIGSFATLSFPFGETLAFTMFFSSFKTKRSPYKVYILGLLLSGIVVFAVSVTNFLVLGEHTVSGIYYTSYETAKYIDIFKRSEIIIGSVLILGGFIKISITLSATCKGIAKVFRCKDYKCIVTLVAILVIATSYLTFDSIIVAKEFGAEIYPYYSFLFFVILPIIILIVAEIKNKQLVSNLSKNE
ncbi:GerAB/ArcD/ProY family transporter [Oceanirhabdus seepicola]|uniref:GerAB/ArcD/ProY family transporter n=1 Tax=Oceanirhabdus seepicola TaxID=2828781 RepID=A0A9J6P099_9CLOT|nr:GerAB/ArcD/ProY family transporter [Oceanirhabdus seepicola]MCM1988848.1 GerAB/ArcD/ProY family transporter [Oceanirhabdus seepicola]